MVQKIIGKFTHNVHTHTVYADYTVRQKASNSTEYYEFKFSNKGLEYHWISGEKAKLGWQTFTLRHPDDVKFHEKMLRIHTNHLFETTFLVDSESETKE